MPVPATVIRTRAIPPLGTLDRMWRQAPSVAWLRGGEGMLGWGVAARAHFRGAERFSRAQRWAAEQLGRADIADRLGVARSAPIAFSSFTFDDESEGSVVVIPRTLIGLQDGVSWRTDIVTPADDGGSAGPPDGIADLLGREQPAAPEPKWHDETASAARWRSSVGEALKRIASGELDKVVLARAVSASFDEPVPIAVVLNRLAARFGECWTFHVEGLVGATPELLVRRRRERVVSRVLAGSVPSSGSAGGDSLAARELRGSTKNLAEHEYAVRSVAHSLAVHCTDLDVPPAPTVLALPYVQHLATDITGNLADGASALALAASLHPTAAVCGTPTERARSVIGELEDMDRGRYSGPVGWFDTNGDGEFAIALRCAQFSPDRRSAQLYAGCGLVADSDIDAELAESEVKLQAMRRGLGG